MSAELWRKTKAAAPSVLRGTCIILVAVVASATIGGSIVGRAISGIALDSLLRSEPAKNENMIRLVDITEDDYRDIFHRKRPLDPATILAMVRGAITGGAKLVAVDINTSDWPSDVNMDLQGDAAVVWAEDYFYQRKGTRRERIMSPLLGRPLSATSECYGVPALGEEAGVVRWFYSGVDINSSIVPSFVEQVVFRSTHNSCNKEAKDDALEIIDFSANVPEETASTLIKEMNSPDWRTARLYEGQIIVIGGSFHSGDDLKETPAGPWSGLEINGAAISSLLNGKAHREVDEGQAVAADFLIGIVLVFAGIFGRATQIVVTGATIVFAFFLSLYVFRQYYLFLSFVPICGGIATHLFLDKAFHRGEHRDSSHEP